MNTSKHPCRVKNCDKKSIITAVCDVCSAVMSIIFNSSLFIKSSMAGLLCLLIWINSSYAGKLSSLQFIPDSQCPDTAQLSIVNGERISSLIGTPIQDIALFRYADSFISTVVFQIDEKNSQGRYRLSETIMRPLFTENDELVFRTADGGEQLPENSSFFEQHEFVEIEIKESLSGSSSWLYAVISDHQQPAATQHSYISYDNVSDVVSAAEFKIGFSPSRPFLVESFQWKMPGNNNWSADVTDMMKIRHKGEFLGYLDFERDQDDYTSELTAVKQGPLRIIRRTKNRVRVFWKLKTPSLDIDYVISADGFVMDTTIDIPINVGLFFNHLETITTMDWNNDPQLPLLLIESAASLSPLPVKGFMSVEKEAFNSHSDNHFSVHSGYGDFFVKLDISEGFPIRYWLYLYDDLNAIDEPENYAGQYGNVGFRTTQWENIDQEVHHLKFSVCIRSAH